MKKTILTFALSAIMLATMAFNYIVTYRVNVEESTVTWVGKKIAYDHSGTIKILDGNLDIANGDLIGGSFTIDMTTIVNVDIENAEKNAQLVGHLNSEDFFNVAEFPTAKMDITSVKKQKSDAGNYMISGDLTIKGITNSVEFPANITIDGDMVSATATVIFDRSKYNVRYGSGSFFDDLGDKVIYDDIELGVELIANK